jgi:uncharacterized protein YkwD
LAGCAAACAGFAVVSPPAVASPWSTSSSALLVAINEARAANGVRPLRVDPRLTRAARSHSADMVRRQYFAHGSFALRLRQFDVRGRMVGENIAWGVGSLATARSIVAQWLASPPHRANLLGTSFRRIGLGAAVGPFAGHGRARVVTADFAG